MKSFRRLPILFLTIASCAASVDALAQATIADYQRGMELRDK